MAKLNLSVSDRCFFPWSAFRGSANIVKLAFSLGYSQVEFHPTWGIYLEYQKHKRLLCNPKHISSFHIDWRQDRIMDKTPFLKRFFHLPSQLFPPIKTSLSLIQNLEKKYQRPAVIHWPENINQYHEPILELHKYLSLGPDLLIKYLKKGQLKGVLIDTAKFDAYLEKHQVLSHKNKILRRLKNNIKEIHFRIKCDSDLKALSGGPKTSSVSLMTYLLKNKYPGQIVIEAGWPDAGRVANLWRVDKAKAKKIHHKIISFINSTNYN